MLANIPIDDFSSEDLLQDWMWLLGKPHDVIALNNFADMFVRAKDGRVGMVNVSWGTLESLTPDTNTFEQMTRDRENQAKWFLTDFLTEIEQAGLVLGKEQCFSFTLPLRMGGKMELSNVEVTQVRIYVSIMGQILQQLKDVPPGTKIKGLKIG